jgi:hypothetical protein
LPPLLLDKDAGLCVKVASSPGFFSVERMPRHSSAESAVDVGCTGEAKESAIDGDVALASALCDSEIKVGDLLGYEGFVALDGDGNGVYVMFCEGA